jgi:hypothetical protein
MNVQAWAKVQSQVQYFKSVDVLVEEGSVSMARARHPIHAQLASCKKGKKGFVCCSTSRPKRRARRSCGIYLVDREGSPSLALNLYTKV